MDEKNVNNVRFADDLMLASKRKEEIEKMEVAVKVV